MYLLACACSIHGGTYSTLVHAIGLTPIGYVYMAPTNSALWQFSLVHFQSMLS